MLCEQCGNDFYRGRKMVKEHKVVIQCPFCRWDNTLPERKRKKCVNNGETKNERTNV